MRKPNYATQAIQGTAADKRGPNPCAANPSNKPTDPTPEVPAMLGEVRSRVSSLADVVSALESKLEPILTPPDKDNQSEPGPYAVSCEVAMTLADVARQTQATHNRVVAILMRLAL